MEPHKRLANVSQSPVQLMGSTHGSREPHQGVDGKAQLSVMFVRRGLLGRGGPGLKQAQPTEPVCRRLSGGGLGNLILALFNTAEKHHASVGDLGDFHELL